MVSTMVVLVKGIKFKVRLLEKKVYIKKHSENSYAHCDRQERELVFRKDHIKKKTIIHEVTHAFINSIHLGSTDDLTINDFEEIICEMLEDHLMDINKLSNQILAYLKESK